MILSTWTAKWMMRLYPPLFFNRIQVVKFDEDFSGCELKVKKSIWNRNMNGTIFGGTIFSAADPFYAILFWQIFARKGYKVQTWLKSAQIHYLKPADSSLKLIFKISQEEINEAEKSINSIGKYVATHSVEMKDTYGNICAIAHTEVYIRLIKNQQSELSGF